MSRSDVSLGSLLESTREFDITEGRFDRADMVSFRRVRTISFDAMNFLLCTSIAIGEEDYYKTLIAFYDLSYTGYGLSKPSEIDTPVRVSCSCPDFYFTFSEWNYEENSLYGRRRKKYTRKTFDRPERNIYHIPGLCKHLVNLKQILLDLNIIERSHYAS